MGETSSGLQLDEIVRDVALQLHKLRDVDKPVDPALEFKGCDIELSVTAKVEGGGGIRFYVVSADAKASSEQSSKIKLSFGAAGTPIVMMNGAAGSAPTHNRQ